MQSTDDSQANPDISTTLWKKKVWDRYYFQWYLNKMKLKKHYSPNCDANGWMRKGKGSTDKVK